MPDNTPRLGLTKLTAEQTEEFDSGNATLSTIDALVDLYIIELSRNSPPIDPASGDAYIVGDVPTGDWADHAEQIACWNEGWVFYTPFNGLHAFVASNSTLVVYDNSTWVAVGSADFASRSGTETLSNKTIAGSFAMVTAGSRIGVTSDASPITPSALFEIVNNNAVTCGFRESSRWVGSTALSYQNNDSMLIETFNKVTSDSENYSWSISAPNAYNDIPAGMYDSGERVGVYGWATSVSVPGEYTHAGRLRSQIGVRGRAGFQGDVNPSPAGAGIDKAVGVKGEVRNDSAFATISRAIAGEFTSIGPIGIVENNIGVYSQVTLGTSANWSFFGAAGELYNEDRAFFGEGSVTARQSTCTITARGTQPNALEFGHPAPGGYGSNLGRTGGSGYPFLAFSAEADPTGNTFRTRGKKGVVISSDLAGGLIFSRLADSNAAEQSVTESGRFDLNGHLVLAETAVLKTKTPATANAAGIAGEVTWDASHIYVCVATNSWKRVAIAAW